MDTLLSTSYSDEYGVETMRSSGFFSFVGVVLDSTFPVFAKQFTTVSALNIRNSILKGPFSDLLTTIAFPCRYSSESRSQCCDTNQKKSERIVPNIRFTGNRQLYANGTFSTALLGDFPQHLTKQDMCMYGYELIYSNGVTAIDADTLSSCAVRSISLENNYIQEIPELSLTEETSKLSLAGNMLTSPPQFTGDYVLQSLNLSRNKLVSLPCDEIFRAIPCKDDVCDGLRTFDVSSNLLSNFLLADWFQYFFASMNKFVSEDTFLLLSNNSMTSVLIHNDLPIVCASSERLPRCGNISLRLSGPKAVKQFGTATQSFIDLSLNNFGLIRQDSFRNLYSLQVLNLTRSGIDRIEGGFISGGSCAREGCYIGLSGNNLGKDIALFESAILYQTRNETVPFMTLDLSDNGFTRVPYGVGNIITPYRKRFDRVKNGKAVLIIDLRYNRITTISKPLCSGIPDDILSASGDSTLKVELLFDLSFNTIDHVDVAMFDCGAINIHVNMKNNSLAKGLWSSNNLRVRSLNFFSAEGASVPEFPAWLGDIVLFPNLWSVFISKSDSRKYMDCCDVWAMTNQQPKFLCFNIDWIYDIGVALSGARSAAKRYKLRHVDYEVQINHVWRTAKCKASQCVHNNEVLLFSRFDKLAKSEGIQCKVRLYPPLSFEDSQLHPFDSFVLVASLGGVITVYIVFIVFVMVTVQFKRGILQTFIAKRKRPLTEELIKYDARFFKSYVGADDLDSEAKHLYEEVLMSSDNSGYINDSLGSEDGHGYEYAYEYDYLQRNGTKDSAPMPCVQGRSLGNVARAGDAKDTLGSEERHDYEYAYTYDTGERNNL